MKAYYVIYTNETDTRGYTVIAKGADDAQNAVARHEEYYGLLVVFTEPPVRFDFPFPLLGEDDE